MNMKLKLHHIRYLLKARQHCVDVEHKLIFEYFTVNKMTLHFKNFYRKYQNTSKEFSPIIKFSAQQRA